MRRGASLCCFSACVALALTFAPAAPGAANGAKPASASPPAAAQPALEEELLVLVNRDRIQEGIPPLQIDANLVRIAREHSQRMAAARVVSHELPDSGDLKARLSGAGNPYRSARENLARAATVSGAQDALATSPGHLRNMRATDVTHVGVGVVRGEGPYGEDLYVTEIFSDPATLHPAEAVRDAFVAQVLERRRHAGLEPLPVDPVFVQAALHSLVELDSSIEGDALRRLMADAVGNLRRARPQIRAPARVAVDIQLLHDVRELKVSGHVLQPNATAFGTGAFEARDRDSRPIVVLLSLICLE